MATRTGRNTGASSTNCPHRCASRHCHSSPRLKSWRRAASLNLTPGSSSSARIRSLSPTRHRLRRSTPVKISICPLCPDLNSARKNARKINEHPVSTEGCRRRNDTTNPLTKPNIQKRKGLHPPKGTGHSGADPKARKAHSRPGSGVTGRRRGGLLRCGLLRRRNLCRRSRRCGLLRSGSLLRRRGRMLRGRCGLLRSSSLLRRCGGMLRRRCSGLLRRCSLRRCWLGCRFRSGLRGRLRGRLCYSLGSRLRSRLRGNRRLRLRSRRSLTIGSSLFRRCHGHRLGPLGGGVVSHFDILLEA